ncbi:MAG TPA: multicopper oxidase family protein [Aeromicrobium sp.]|nr:multicopper oxidase family protein [Aeromicrobium sp.]
MSTRVRLVVGGFAALLILGSLGWMWKQSLLPDAYSATAMGYPDYGVDPQGRPLPPSSDHYVHGHHGQHGQQGQTVSVDDLVEHTDRTADVRVDLTAQANVLTMAGHEIDGYTINGESPGETIVASQGQLVEVRLHNQNVAEGVALHWHGIDVPNAEDGVAGVTQDAVLPGKSHTYRFVARKAGTFWYHSHQLSHQQVAGGLFGAVVILPKHGIDQKLDLTAVAHTYSGNRTLNGKAGDARAEAKPGQKARVRIVNTDNGTLTTWASVPYRVVAVDGYDIAKPTTVGKRRLDIPAGGRADLEVTVPRKDAARVQVGAATAYVIGPRLAYPDAPPQPGTALDLLSYGSGKADIPKPNRSFTYSIGRRPGFLDGRPGFWWTINGQLLPEVPMFMVRRGDVVKFHIDNHSGEAHPMHLHGHHALVVARDGKPVTGGPLWVDSIDVQDDQTIDLVFRADNPGIWMDHCHNLPHAAQGLVAHLMYEGVTTPYKLGGKAQNRPE